MARGRRRHLRRHRGAHQPAADREGDPGGGLLQGDRTGDDYRVSMRSKGDVDVGAVAKQFGGGGHKNAAGCTVHGPIARGARRLRRADRRRDRAGARRTLGASVAASPPVAPIDGVLVVDKPGGLTSHDVVAARAARARRARASATPARSIRWPPACCRCSSAAPRGSRSSSPAPTRRTTPRSASAGRTDTYDALGEPRRRRGRRCRSTAAALERALDAFRGSFAQQPPAFSAKKSGRASAPTSWRGADKAPDARAGAR